MTNENQALNDQPLTQKVANEIGGAMQELAGLSTKSIVEADDAARKRALTSFLSSQLLAHAGELLACWFTIEQEYKPMLQSQATTLSHVLTILERRNAILQAQNKKPAGPAPAEEQQQQQPDNVVQLVTKAP